MGGGRLAFALERSRDGAVGETKAQRPVAPGLKVGPSRAVEPCAGVHAGGEPEGTKEAVRAWPRGRDGEGRAHEEDRVRAREETAHEAYGLVMDDGEGGDGAGRDGRGGVGALRAPGEVPKARAEQPGLLGRVVAAVGAARERLPETVHELEDVAATRAVREEAVPATAGLFGKEPCERLERRSRVRTDRVRLVEAFMDPPTCSSQLISWSFVPRVPHLAPGLPGVARAS